MKHYSTGFITVREKFGLYAKMKLNFEEISTRILMSFNYEEKTISKIIISIMHSIYEVIDNPDVNVVGFSSISIRFFLL